MLRGSLQPRLTRRELNLKNPVMPASGTFWPRAREVESYLDLNTVEAVVTKSATAELR